MRTCGFARPHDKSNARRILFVSPLRQRNSARRHPLLLDCWILLRNKTFGLVVEKYGRNVDCTILGERCRAIVFLVNQTSCLKYKIV